MPERAASPAAGAPSRVGRRRDRERVIVHDSSMRPTLEPGDRLIVDRGAYRERAPVVGEIVVVVDPEAASRWLVKRVARVDPDGSAIEVRGDAAAVARDSRRFGPVGRASIVGRAVRLYFPPHRRRDL